MSKNILGHGKPEHIYRQTARNQPKDEIKKEQEKVVEEEDGGEGRLIHMGMEWDWGGWMEAERERLITPRNYETPYGMPHLEKDRTLSGNSEKRSKLIQKSCLLPFSLPPPNALIGGRGVESSWDMDKARLPHYHY